MKQFSLEEYLANPSRKVVTRDGRDVKIICTDRVSKKGYPLVALVMNDGHEHVHTYNVYGQYYTGGTNHDLDLFFASEKHEEWINLYKWNNSMGGIKMDLNKIKQEIFSKIKFNYTNISNKDICKIIDDIPQNKFKPLTITEIIKEVDKDDLFDRKVSEIITFLSQYKDCTLEERWNGYIDNYFTLTQERQENLDEIVNRIYNDIQSDCQKYVTKEEELKKIEKQISELQNKRNKILNL